MLNRFLVKIILAPNASPLPGSKCANCMFRKSGTDDIYIKCNTVEPLRILSVSERYRGIPVLAELGSYLVYERVLKRDIFRHVLRDKMYNYRIIPNNIYNAIEDLINQKPLIFSNPLCLDDNQYNELEKIYKVKDYQCLNCAYVRQLLEVNCDILNAGELLFNSPDYDMYVPVNARVSFESRAKSFNEDSEDDPFSDGI